MHRNSVARLSKIEWFSFHPISFWRFIFIIKHLVIVTNKCWDYRRILFHYRRFTLRGDNQGRSFISLIFLSKYLCRVKEWRFRDCERVLNYYAKIFLLFSFPSSGAAITDAREKWSCLPSDDICFRRRWRHGFGSADFVEYSPKYSNKALFRRCSFSGRILYCLCTSPAGWWRETSYWCLFT